jgi:hypothetical protein
MATKTNKTSTVNANKGKGKDDNTFQANMPSEDDMVNMLKTLIANAEKEITESVKTLEGITAEIDEKQAEIKTLRTQQDDLTAQVRPTQRKINNWKAALADLEKPTDVGTTGGNRAGAGRPPVTTLPNWLTGLPDEFTADDVANTHNMPRSSVLTYLSRYSKDGRFIERVSTGTYRLLAANS